MRILIIAAVLTSAVIPIGFAAGARSDQQVLTFISDAIQQSGTGRRLSPSARTPLDAA